MHFGLFSRLDPFSSIVPVDLYLPFTLESLTLLSLSLPTTASYVRGIRTVLVLASHRADHATLAIASLLGLYYPLCPWSWVLVCGTQHIPVSRLRQFRFFLVGSGPRFPSRTFDTFSKSLELWALD